MVSQRWCGWLHGVQGAAEPFLGLTTTTAEVVGKAMWRSTIFHQGSFLDWTSLP